MALFFVSISKEFRSLATIAGGYSSLAFSFVGYTFPAEGMPKAIQIMDYIFPLTSYARMYINIAMRGNPIKYSISFFTGLLVFATIGLLSLPKFSKVLQKGGYDDQKLD
jgi:ABC-2 type transport system permease protein